MPELILHRSPFYIAKSYTNGCFLEIMRKCHASYLKNLDKKLTVVKPLIHRMRAINNKYSRTFNVYIDRITVQKYQKQFN